MEKIKINFEEHIRNIPDFPIKGIQFKDITTLIKEGAVFSSAVDYMYDPFRQKTITKIVGIESRGFIFGAAMAYKLNVGFIPIRKPGKLPGDILAEEYQLEYGKDSVEVHIDGINKEDKVLIVDDLLATGGTAGATAKLIERIGAEIVGFSFLIELTELNGRAKISDYELHSLIQYDV
jgi:adenine phosphoribosyltransferase